MLGLSPHHECVLVWPDGTGRREASSLRAFQESLKSWALQRMNECTADVARLGCRLIVGYVLHHPSLTLRHIDTRRLIPCCPLSHGRWEAEQTRITTLESLLRKETQRRRKLFNDLQVAPIQQLNTNPEAHLHLPPARSTA